MSENEVRRDESEQPAQDQDALVAALRDIPRLRSIQDDKYGNKVFVAPPPFVSRIGGMAHGCGGLLLTLMGLLMLLTAMWFGYYLWGPGLLLTGGLLLLGASVSVWRGSRSLVIASMVALAGIGIVGYFWDSYIPAAGSLAPISGLGIIFAPAWYMVILVLVISFVVNVLALIQWKRLSATPRRSLVIWISIGVGFSIMALALHFTQQQQRESWLDDHMKDWTAEASSDSLPVGWSANVTLGYSFVQIEEGDNDNFDVRLAELNAALDGGAELVRITASGDLLLEAELPRMFKEDEDDADAAQKTADRLAHQQELEAQYMARVTDSGVKVVLSDAQYSPYLIVWGSESEGDKIAWEDFVEIQENRIRHYAAEYQPYAYEIITEPDAYRQYSVLAMPEDQEELDLWVEQTERLIEAVQSASPETLIGVSVGLQSDLDLDYYNRVLELEGVDFIGVGIFQPGAFDVLEEVFEERGRPSEHDKQMWIVETWYGYCLAPQRSMELDAKWLELTAAFASKENFSAML
ncbi:MAG: MerC domain-containing protein, partial [Chloroflexi bacterium]|nr:MerC domain-containing protein [Chloroflexota bacterium]